jgi:hypothetical protein
MGDLPYTDRLVVERDGSGGDDASVHPAPKPPAGGVQITSDVAGEAFLSEPRCHGMSPRCRLWSRANAGGLMMLPLSALTRRALVAATTAFVAVAPAALHCTGAIDAGIRAGVAQVAGAAIHVARASSSLCGQTGAARAVAEAALRRAGAGGRAVTAPVAIASRAIETTATRPTSTTGATAARGAGATLDQGVAGA